MINICMADNQHVITDNMHICLHVLWGIACICMINICMADNQHVYIYIYIYIYVYIYTVYTWVGIAGYLTIQYNHDTAILR